MSTDIRKWIEEIWEYCQEHWIVALAIGIVLLILLVSAVLILSARRDDDEDEFWDDLDEEEYLEELPAKPVLPEASCEPADSLPEREVPAVTAGGVVENLLKNVESASGAAGQKVESIELKIEKAQLTIRYVDGIRREETVEELEAESKPAPAEEEAAPAAEILQEKPKAYIQEEKREEITAQPKKFGADNWNTARSGRVYTEEELYGQIID